LTRSFVGRHAKLEPRSGSSDTLSIFLTQWVVGELCHCCARHQGRRCLGGTTITNTEKGLVPSKTIDPKFLKKMKGIRQRQSKRSKVEMNFFFFRRHYFLSSINDCKLGAGGYVRKIIEWVGLF
jgi:hypothetical protein